jgi:hypothetical protein
MDRVVSRLGLEVCGFKSNAKMPSWLTVRHAVGGVSSRSSYPFGTQRKVFAVGGEAIPTPHEAPGTLVSLME